MNIKTQNVTDLEQIGSRFWEAFPDAGPESLPFQNGFNFAIKYDYYTKQFRFSGLVYNEKNVQLLAYYRSDNLVDQEIQICKEIFFIYF
jgi:hypothetical protein